MTIEQRLGFTQLLAKTTSALEKLTASAGMPRINPEQTKENLKVAYYLLGNGPGSRITEMQIERVLKAESDVLRNCRSAKPLCIIGRVNADEGFLSQALKFDTESGLLLACNFMYGKARNLRNEAFEKRDNPRTSGELRTTAAACLRACR